MRRTDVLSLGAVFSADRRYRYMLTRQWSATGSSVCWIMLNPSLADDLKDDPTIRRVIDFSRRWRFGGMTVVNLFSRIATKRSRLAWAEDPIGPLTDNAIRRAISGRQVICAWGDLTGLASRLRDRDRDVMAILRATATNAKCLGLTQYGYPRHPLYVRSIQRPCSFAVPLTMIEDSERA